MTSSRDAENAFHKISTTFHDKTFNKLEIKRNFLNLIKSIYEKLTDNIRLNSERLNVFPYDQEQDKDVHSCHLHLILSWKVWPEKVRKKLLAGWATSHWFL